MRYAYYPGCSLTSTAQEYDLSARAVCRELGVALDEVADWNCCGASPGHCTSARLAHALAGRNLALAERQGMDLAVVCPACLLRLRTTRRRAKADADFRRDLEGMLEMPYEAAHDVRHLLEILSDEVGMTAIRRRVRKPLRGLRLVCYYGCFLVRPPEVMRFDDPENPQALDVLMNTLGAAAVDWPGKVDCCGGSLALSRRDVVTKLVGDLADLAEGAGAKAIVTACPLCQANLESRQKGERFPVFYFTELMGLAFGVKDVHTWFKKHLVNPLPLLASHGLL